MLTHCLILGAGAAGMMAAAQTGPGTIVIDHARMPGEKIRISGGGRCNFTNMYAEPKNYLGENPHFHKSALSRYTQWDFIELVSRHGIAWHEKTLGQLFCDDKATQIVDMLREELVQAGAELWLQTSLRELTHADGLFTARLDREGRTVTVQARNLVLATGGKSIPKMGATGLAYDIARQFGHDLTETRPALVPFTFEKRFAPISGVATPARLSNDRASFDEALLFTHRGLSGPAVLQLSSYWREGETVVVDLLPGTDLAGLLKAQRGQHGKRSLTTELGFHLPARLVDFLAAEVDLTGNLADLSDKRIDALSDSLHRWGLKPGGTEGYRTAEVTLGGIATTGLSSKSMESTQVPGLYAIGEAVDVTGWLGGYNFQWAWSSGWAAGQAIREKLG
ncbi:NAD(P)/FAD-dependent oxidoreductase [Tropicibacter alexandrii]|uniref:NAD(P)/FAD-dependent oxidoreductase n=1 Tax=Tropicibacter alexandrii TaxID=2267683 RepID=UPI00100909B4|nr:NAD(P)/FAD-dependent oxidoreductase [Tropicibacter alexandrii]